MVTRVGDLACPQLVLEALWTGVRERFGVLVGVDVLCLACSLPALLARQLATLAPRWLLRCGPRLGAGGAV